MSRAVRLADAVYAALEEAARASGKTPADWIAAHLPETSADDGATTRSRDDWLDRDFLKTYAQEAAALPQVEAKLLEARMMLGEMIEHFKMPHLNKAARTALLERAERILYRDTNDTGTTSRPEAAQ